jgi:hypothetical protein
VWGRGAVGYRQDVSLLACPFCREMFEQGEAKTCPVCGMALAPFEKLPPSYDAQHDEAGVPTAPEIEAFSFTYLGRGRGALALLAAIGLVLFFLPWVRMTMPYIDAVSAFDMARHRIGWLWAAGVAWIVLIPTVLSRRTILQLRGARVAAAFLSAIPAVAVVVLLARSPKRAGGGLVPIVYTWNWPIYAMLGVSLVAIAFSLRLGGRIDDIKVGRGSSKGQAVH